jgi:hypothetical protein
VDVHLLVDEVLCCERNIQLTGHEEDVPLHSISIKITGDAWFNSGGLRYLQSGSYKWW